jgi:hypothetical protein
MQDPGVAELARVRIFSTCENPKSGDFVYKVNDVRFVV